jgi:hypothetical protein
MMSRSSMGVPSFSLSLIAFNRGREDGNPCQQFPSLTPYG